jgi:hypothetical protein
MTVTKAEALYSLKPNAEWNMVGDTINWLDSSETQPSDSEIETEVTRLTNLLPMTLLKNERDSRLAACDWRASSDLTLADAWKTYRQSLRDLPASSTPTLDSDGNLDMSSVTFPTEPS